jgi:murein DD-endopeptidase MepM/ murein hydrolase activator NlpD
MRIAALLLFVAIAVAHTATVAMSRDAALALGRADIHRFYKAEKGSLWASMSEKMKAAMKSEDALLAMSAQIQSQFGEETSVLHEDALPVPGGLMAYTRIVKFEKYPAPMVVTFAFSPAAIEGFFIKPEPNPAPTDFLGYKDKTRLFFPLHGAWTIYQGGRTVAENYHAATPDERFAYDIVMLKEGQLYKTDGKINEDWYSFGQPVLADADGQVVKAIDAYDDNQPLKPSETNPKYGNSVVIDHGNGEFSMYAPLKRGSVTVKEGQTAKAGQQIGLTGNSGNSPFTHLHYHLQNSGEWFNGQGLPVSFSNIVVNGKLVTDAEPVRGDTVEQR